MAENKQKPKRNLAIVGVVLAVAALLIAVGGLGITLNGQAPRTHRLTLVMGEGKIIQEVNGTDQITGEFHRWEPAVLVMKKCDTIILTVQNPRSNIHSFAIEALGIDTGAIPGKVLTPPSGEERIVTISTCQSGTYKFICDTPHDHDAGECDPDHDRMTGYLTVLE